MMSACSLGHADFQKATKSIVAVSEFVKQPELERTFSTIQFESKCNSSNLQRQSDHLLLLTNSPSPVCKAALRLYRESQEQVDQNTGPDYITPERIVAIARN